jgi:hypothetical protein
MQVKQDQGHDFVIALLTLVSTSVEWFSFTSLLLANSKMSRIYSNGGGGGGGPECNFKNAIILSRMTVKCVYGRIN